MKKAILSFCIIMMVTACYSCTKDTAPAPVVVTGNCDTSKVNFSGNLTYIIDHNCSDAAGGGSCHSPGHGSSQQDFTSYVIVKSDIDNILCRIRYPGTAVCGARMPSGLPQLPQAQKDSFFEWKANGFYNCQ